MASYLNQNGNSIGSLLRLIQEQKSQSPIVSQAAEVASPLREAVAEPLKNAESIGTSRVVSLKPEQVLTPSGEVAPGEMPSSIGGAMPTPPPLAMPTPGPSAMPTPAPSGSPQQRGAMPNIVAASPITSQPSGMRPSGTVLGSSTQKVSSAPIGTQIYGPAVPAGFKWSQPIVAPPVTPTPTPPKNPSKEQMNQYNKAKQSWWSGLFGMG